MKIRKLIAIVILSSGAGAIASAHGRDTLALAPAAVHPSVVQTVNADATIKAFAADIKVAHIPQTMQFALPGSVFDYGGGNIFSYPAYYVIVDQCASDYSRCVRIELYENCAITNCLSGTAVALAPETALECYVFASDASSYQEWPCTFTINEARDTFHIVGSAIPAPAVSGEEMALGFAINYVAAPALDIESSDGTHSPCYWRRHDTEEVMVSTSDQEFSVVSPPGDVTTAGNCDPNATPPEGTAVLDAATDIVAASLVLFDQPPSPIVLNQHGLTGTWYDAATSGQGLLFEEFPSINQMFIGWFTYDADGSGGESGQRWYALQGSVPVDASQIDLTIYAGYGGNFAAPPAVATSAVGNATLRFESCSSGTLDYFFYDGRQGSIPLARFFEPIDCTVTGESVAAPTQYLLSGNWYDTAASGQGVQFEFNTLRHQLFGAWYTYGPAGNLNDDTTTQRWYSFQMGDIAADQTSFASIPLFETVGGTFDMPGAGVTTQVGTIGVTYQDCTSAILAYTFNAGENEGSTGSMTLSRVGPVPEGCSL